MADRGQVFTARAMLSAMYGHIWKQFVRGQALRDGVPGLLRASILVAFHFFVWAAFWQLSGVGRTAADDRLLRRLGTALESTRRVSKLSGVPFRLARRLLGR